MEILSNISSSSDNSSLISLDRSSNMSSPSDRDKSRCNSSLAADGERFGELEMLMSERLGDAEVFGLERFGDSATGGTGGRLRESNDGFLQRLIRGGRSWLSGGACSR